jgi:hypothetical protein
VAGENGITIYTIGYGAGVNEELLEDVANATGGKYYFAGNAAQLESAFEAIGESLEPTSAIARPPLTSNVSSGGNTFSADIPGDTSHLANVTSGGYTHLNLNDPTAPSVFSVSFPHPDPESFELNMTSYECADDGWNATGQTETVGGETLAVLRCTDVGALEKSYGADITLSGQRPDQLLSTTYASWQTDVNSSLEAFPGVNINETTGRFEARSNQALITIDLPPEGSGTRNSLALLLDIGLSDADSARDVLNVRIAEASVRN